MVAIHGGRGTEGCGRSEVDIRRSRGHRAHHRASMMHAASLRSKGLRGRDETHVQALVCRWACPGAGARQAVAGWRGMHGPWIHRAVHHVGSRHLGEVVGLHWGSAETGPWTVVAVRGPHGHGTTHAGAVAASGLHPHVEAAAWLHSHVEAAGWLHAFLTGEGWVHGPTRWHGDQHRVGLERWEHSSFQGPGWQLPWPQSTLRRLGKLHPCPAVPVLLI
mmetsp:Transcript_78735/g.163765  ORF Transcript_78735/g.163765 Transcript_78735/m.163765 type:complete len:219 (-) Transcript_78735:1120-1776(-)